jgi:hypothetical protein
MSIEFNGTGNELPLPEGFKCQYCEHPEVYPWMSPGEDIIWEGKLVHSHSVRTGLSPHPPIEWICRFEPFSASPGDIKG